jgi:hypothetical protein
VTAIAPTATPAHEPVLTASCLLTGDDLVTVRPVAEDGNEPAALRVATVTYDGEAFVYLSAADARRLADLADGFATLHGHPRR